MADFEITLRATTGAKLVHTAVTTIDLNNDNLNIEWSQAGEDFIENVYGTTLRANAENSKDIDWLIDTIKSGNISFYVFSNVMAQMVINGLEFKDVLISPTIDIAVDLTPQQLGGF